MNGMTVYVAEHGGLQLGVMYIFRTISAPRNFFFGGGNPTNSVADRGQRERGSWGGSPLFRGSGGSCNLVQEI
jgi:hypothetical protein